MALERRAIVTCDGGERAASRNETLPSYYSSTFGKVVSIDLGCLAQRLDILLFLEQLSLRSEPQRMRRRRDSDEWEAEGLELVAVVTEAFVIFRTKRGIFYSSAGTRVVRHGSNLLRNCIFLAHHPIVMSSPSRGYCRYENKSMKA